MDVVMVRHENNEAVNDIPTTTPLPKMTGGDSNRDGVDYDYKDEHLEVAVDYREEYMIYDIPSGHHHTTLLLVLMMISVGEGNV